MGLVPTNPPDLSLFNSSDKTALTYEWPLSASLQRLLPGAVLILLILWRARQGRGAWLILLPVGAALVALAILEAIYDPEAFWILHATISAGTVGLACAWLTSVSADTPRPACYRRIALVS